MTIEPQTLPKSRQLDAWAARRDYLEYIKFVFPEYSGSEYRDNWHHRELAKKIQEFADPTTDLDRLMVFMPPQHGKTAICSRLLPGWILGHHPDTRIMGASYNTKLAYSISRKAKRVINTKAYSEVFPGTQIPEKHVRSDERHDAKNTVEEWEIVGHRGSYLARGSGQGTDGYPADVILMDDVLSEKMAKSQAKRDAVYEWWSDTLQARLSRNDRVLLVMTRWHLDDIAGRLLDEAREVEHAKEWEVIRFPAIKEAETFPGDPREEGEALWPWHKSLEDLLSIRGPNPDSFEALYQQNPTPPGGAIIKTDDVRYWTQLPGLRGRWIQSWDLRAGGKSKRSSFAVAGLWFQPAKEPANAYLVDQKRARWDFPETVNKFIELSTSGLWAKADEKLVEYKADGRQLVPTLQNKISGIVPVTPGTANKEERLDAVSPFFRSGNVYVPDESIAPWVREYVHELTTFPGSANDDQVDQTSQALNELLVGGGDQGEDIYKGWLT